MSTYDLEQTGPAPLRPAVRPEGPANDPSMVIGLQRLAGNSAVASAIRSGQIGADHGQLDIQRLDDDEDYEDETEDEADSGYGDNDLTEEDEEEEEEDEENFSLS